MVMGLPLASTPIDGPLVPSLCVLFRRFVKRQSLKFTPERAMILDAVLSKKGVFEAGQLFFEMRQPSHRVSKATNYRTLKHLTDVNLIAQVLINSNTRTMSSASARNPRAIWPVWKRTT